MRRPAWLPVTRRSTGITIVASVVAVALVVGAAIASGGYAAQHLALDDASVWVVNGLKQLAGRANTEISRLDTAVPSVGRDLSVEQDGTSVLLVDRSGDSVGRIDPATGELGKTVPLPARTPTVALAGDRAVLVSEGTGRVWLVPLAQLTRFSPSSTPTIDLGARVVTTVTPDGTLFAFSPDAGSVYRVDAATGEAVSATDAVPPGLRGARQVTAAGGDWAVYDASRRRLAFDGRVTTLPSWLGRSAVVQQPSSRAGAPVMRIASPTGLVEVAADGGLRTLERSALGVPAAPVVAGGCVYAAFGSGALYRDCGERARLTRLSGMPAEPALAFAVAGRDVVLNERASGASWNVAHGGALMDNWAELVTKPADRQRRTETAVDTPPEYDRTEEPPVAVDDELGARAGRTTPLPVLLNDYDPNGDVLVVSAVDAIPEAQGTVAIVGDDQRLQITLPAGATGSIGFGYTVTDGRGGSASAHVTVTVRGDAEDSPPVQARTTKATVEAGGRISSQVLGDWYDPDGDPFYLVSASVPAPDTAGSTPDGVVTFSDRGAATGVVQIVLTVSDGRQTATGEYDVTVREAGQVPIIAEPFVVLATAGQETTVSPLAHVRGGTGEVRLSTVPTPAGTDIVPDYDGGTFRFEADTTGTYYLDYGVTDGVTTATGVVRVEVTSPLPPSTTPVTVPHTAFVEAQGSAEIDVLASDVDPGGGVLVVTGVTAPPPTSGVQVETLEQSVLRVTLTRPLASPVTFAYRVSNGLADAAGSVTVVEIPRPQVAQPPIAAPDTVSVRVGDTVDIPVLDNDDAPDGGTLTLDATLPEPLPSGAGLLFASGDVLRYLAPDRPGDYTATYRVDSSDGQWATAQVTIAVRELDAATNSPPVPRTVTARAFAGQTVRIPIPLSGIDPDGDSVQLVGQSSNPEEGAVTRVGPDYLDYRAGDYSAGTDSFRYTVVDALGARATGVARVGIAPASAGASDPVANPDEATARPGRTVSVQVLANDSDPDGSALSLVSVRAATVRTPAAVDGDVVRVTAPATSGRYGFVYTIRNAAGGESSNFLTLDVSPDAPPARPQVSDTTLPLTDVLGHTTVTADVLANVFFADGPTSSLDVSVVQGYDDGVRVTSTGALRVAVGPRGRVIPFRVANPADPRAAGYGFLHVPGTDDALPQLRRGAPRLTVASEATLRIDLSDYVVAAGGKSVRLTDTASVRATHADGSSLTDGPRTLVYTSASRYFGPASISFEVTDGSGAGDSAGHVATLVLPITVTPRQNQPPVFTGASVDLEPGTSRTLDLARLTSYPYARDSSELTWSATRDASSDGLGLALSGSQLTVSVPATAPVGTTAGAVVAVHDAVQAGRSGRVAVTVVPSTRPLAVPAHVTAVTPRGQTTSVDVLGPSAATNPYPATPLTVVAVRGIDGASLPSGVAVVPSADRSTLSVTVAASAPPSDASVQYELGDATKDPSRYVWGTVDLLVQDRPDPVSALQVTGIGDRQATLSWAPGAANNSPVTGYDVQVYSQADGSLVSSSSCPSTVCTVATGGNGPDARVRVQVSAHNALGASSPTALSDVYSDVVPAAPPPPAVYPLDRGLAIAWSRPSANGGSAVTSYVVSYGTQAVTVPCTADTCSTTVGGLANGTAVPVSVSARNATPAQFAAFTTSPTRTGTPAGAPVAVGDPSATATQDGSGTVTVSYAGVFPAVSNGATVTRLWVAAYGGVAPSCTATGVGTGSPGVTIVPNGASVKEVTGGGGSTAFRVSSGSASTFAVFAYNGQGCTRSAEEQATPRTPPSAPTIVVTPPQPEAQTASLSAGTTPLRARATITQIVPGSAGDPSATLSYQYEYGVDGQWGPPQPAASGTSVDAVPQPGRAGQVRVQTVATLGGQSVYGPWSDVASAGIPVDIGPAFTTGQDASGAPVISWTGAPSSTVASPFDYASVRYRCDGEDGFSDMAAAGSCTPTGSVGITVQVTTTDAAGAPSVYTVGYTSP